MTIKKLAGLLCASALFLELGIANHATAAFILTIDDLSTAGVDFEVTDSNGDGLLGFAVGNFNVNATGISKPTITGAPQLLDLSIDVTGGSGNLIITLTDTDYTGVFPGATSLYEGTTIGSIDFDFLYDVNNTPFVGDSILNFPVTVTGDFSGTDTFPVSLIAPYSLTIIADLTHSGPGASSFNAEIRDTNASVVPIPAAV